MTSKMIMLRAEYDSLYNEASGVLRKHDPCQIRKEEDGTVSCLDTRNKVAKGWKGSPELCCNRCEHLGPNGCTAKALSCKTWLCPTAQMANRECSTQLGLIEKRGRAQGIPSLYRASKEKVFAYLEEVEKFNVVHTK